MMNFKTEAKLKMNFSIFDFNIAARNTQNVFLKTHTKRRINLYLESLNMVSKTLEV